MATPCPWASAQWGYSRPGLLGELRCLQWRQRFQARISYRLNRDRRAVLWGVGRVLWEVSKSSQRGQGPFSSCCLSLSPPQTPFHTVLFCLSENCFPSWLIHQESRRWEKVREAVRAGKIPQLLPLGSRLMAPPALGAQASPTAVDKRGFPLLPYIHPAATSPPFPDCLHLPDVPGKA